VIAARDLRTDTAWSEWRRRASAACSRQLAVASFALAQHSGHCCTRASSDGLAHRMHSFHGADHSEAPSGTREEHPRHLVGCHPHCVPAPPCRCLARPAGVSLRRPRSAVENVADLRGSRCGPHGSQMHVCGVSRVGPSRVRFVSDRVRARARGSRGPCEVRGDDNADRGTVVSVHHCALTARAWQTTPEQ